MPLSDTIEKIKPSIVRVVVLLEAEGQRRIISMGSGFLCAPGAVATCYHVIDPATKEEGAEVFIISPDNKLIPVLGGFSEYQKDITVLRIQGEDLPYLTLGDYTGIREGEEVAFCGYPLNLTVPTTSSGIVAAKGNGIIADFPYDVFQLDTAVNVGNSGSPVFLPHSGFVVGMVNARQGSVGRGLRSLIETDVPGGLDIHGMGLMPALKSMAQQMDSNLRLGLGYAVSINYIKEVLNSPDFLNLLEEE